MYHHLEIVTFMTFPTKFKHNRATDESAFSCILRTNHYFITVCIVAYTSLLISRQKYSSLKDIKDQMALGLFHLLITVYTFSYLNHVVYAKLKAVPCSNVLTHSKV